MRTYGTLTLKRGQWHIEAEPHVFMRLKRIFGKVDRRKAGTLQLSHSPETCRDLAWVLDRYPLAVDAQSEIALRGGAQQHHETILRLEQIIDPNYQPQAFAMALPPRSYQAKEAEIYLWPAPTHGPALVKGYRTAAECIDFSLPIASIFLTPAEAKAWGQAHGLPTPKRPLVSATLRRVARGVMRYVVESADPFIIPLTHQGDSRVYPIQEPLRTITSANGGEFALVAPTLINTRNGERHGRHGEQAPRVFDIRQPFGTVTALGSQGALVAAFLAKHNGGNEATGQVISRPCDTITCRENKALIASHLVKLRGGLFDHVLTAQDVRDPAPTITAGGTHIAEVRAFLVKYYGSGVARSLFDPIDTVTTLDRYGLVIVTIAGDDYVLVDIGMRMLTPRELFLLQGFRASYVIDRGIVNGQPKRFTKRTQIRLCGNSVPPDLAAAVVRANLMISADEAWRSEQTA